ncbi:MAG: DUF885 domain-containing protein [Anaerotruncus sp.]|nr:DUF885 domain-containing protein [Anaerotruncus sp.]
MKSRNLQRLLAVLLVWSICLCLAGCQTSEPKPFDLFIQELPTQLFPANSFTLRSLFAHPENYGFPQELCELPFFSEQDYADSKESTQQLLEQLHAYPYEELSEAQQLTYDILDDYFTRSLPLSDYYYLDNSMLGSFNGFQASLPLLLQESSFYNQNDLDGYFHILETTEETFLQYAAFEEQRLAQQMGPCQTFLDGVIEQCQNFAAEQQPFLIASINQKIDQLDFLDETQKQQAKQRNESLLKNEFRNAYLSLADALSALEGAPEPLGLAHFEGGKEYYTALLQARLGTDQSVEEIWTLIEEQQKQILRRFYLLLLQYPQTYEQFHDPYYGDFESAEQTIAFLANACVADYPALPQLNYRVLQIPENMRENYSPAAYVVSEIDSPLSDPQSIYLNGAFHQALFPTLAHEGYPGHMYQNTYFKNLQPPLIRQLLDHPGYTEGWASYVETRSLQYAPTYAPELEAFALNEQLSLLSICLLDIGIHYHGWEVEQAHQEALHLGFSLDLSNFSEGIYKIILENPCYYPTYIVSQLLFEQLRATTEQALGDDFSPIEFHQVLLETGPASFPILQKQLDRYLRQKQLSAPAQAA